MQMSSIYLFNECIQLTISQSQAFICHSSPDSRIISSIYIYSTEICGNFQLHVVWLITMEVQGQSVHAHVDSSIACAR